MSNKNSFNDLLCEINSIFNNDLKKIDDLINDNIHHAKVPLITEIVLHLVKSGGKRLRAIIVLIICKIFNNLDFKKIYIAAAIEFIHNATLLHDDVIDESEVRRGKKTSNNIWGNKYSILVGDFLLTMAFQWAIQCQNLSVLTILSQTSSEIVEGEINQMINTSNINITRDQYISIASAKTAALFSAACETAAIISHSSIIEQQSLYKFGTNLGIAFQIIDDALDYKVSIGKSNQNIGDDFYSGKITLPVILCLENANDQERKFWQNTLNNNDKSFKKAIKYIVQHDAIEKSLKIAEYYTNLAKESLNILPNSSHKLLLINLLECMVYRDL